MNRRQLLQLGLAAPVSLLARKSRIDRSRISTITDENARTPADAIAFAKQYGLQWVELRDVPGAKKHYTALSDEELKQASKEFKDAGLRVSFLNWWALKSTLPGTEPKRNKPETPEARSKRIERDQKQFDDRFTLLEKAIRTAHILEVDKMRIFGFLRIANPQSVMPRIADILGEMAKKCDKEGIKLLVENETSCNVATCAELASVVKMVGAKNFGLNWDALNGFDMKEAPFPEGYALLPKKKIWNVQIKGKSILAGPQHLDWAGIFHALEHDGYQGEVGLECHIFDRQIPASHESMQEILRLVSPS
jgi:L-ribulose-5-phosphate 3-epimerase